MSAEAQKAYTETFHGNLEEAFALYILPLYARLRATGYTHYDLFQ